MSASSRQRFSSSNFFRQLTCTQCLLTLPGFANASHAFEPEVAQESTKEELNLGGSSPSERSEPISSNPPEPDRSTSNPVISPPKAIDEIVPDYPGLALRDGIEGSVVLRLTIDATGRVIEAEVAEPAGHGFDESARRAASRTRYQPALRDGVAVPSRILTRIEFHLPTEIPTGKLEGRVFVPGVDIENTRIDVALRTPDAKRMKVRTDAAGRFQMDDLVPGRYEVSVKRAGFVPLSLVTEVRLGEVSALEIHLEPLEVDEAPIDIVVTAPSTADRIRRSAESVQVIETQHAKRESADLGAVLARTQGVSVRRSGGLGSATRLALNGLSDDQVRFFLDGVPLELAGYTFGIGNIPVNLIERMEIYSGVVPTRFGADALGGAVQLVSQHPRPGTHFGGSYELGSFDSHRLTFHASHQHLRTGFFARVLGFWDRAQNDYPVKVKVPDTAGKLVPARVYRFHDGYRALGTNVELGFEGRPWAERLAVRAYLTDYDKELQHNVAMTVPYGEVTYGETAVGGNFHYEQSWLSGLSLDALGGYAYTRAYVRDVARCVYDWFGRCIAQRVQPGEIDSRPYDRTFWDHSAFGRVGLAWQVNRRHAFRMTLSPTYLTRTGEERRQSSVGAPDPLSAERRVTTIVNGIEYETQLFSKRFENVAFAKQYLQYLIITQEYRCANNAQKHPI